MDKNEVGRQIRSARTNRGWTLEKLVAALASQGVEVTVQAVSGWERGLSYPSCPTALADIFDVPIRTLVP